MIKILLALIVLFLLPNIVYGYLDQRTGQKEIFKDVVVSWYARGLKNPEAFTTACWMEFPKGTKFKVTYRNNSVVVTCNDRGQFKALGRFLDLSSGAFKQLAPLSRGLLKVNVERL